MNENTTELVVTAPLDREESESYRLLLVCTVRTETVITKVETSLDVFVDDEDDNAPYVNGTDTVDIVIGFNRTAVRRFTLQRWGHFWGDFTTAEFDISNILGSRCRAALLARCPCLTGI